jgi:hypothetical protein
VIVTPHFSNLGETLEYRGKRLNHRVCAGQAASSNPVDSFEKRNYILCVRYHGIRLRCCLSERSEDCWAARHRAQDGKMQLFRNSSVFLFKTLKDFKISLANKSQNVRTATPRLKSVDLDWCQLCFVAVSLLFLRNRHQLTFETRCKESLVALGDWHRSRSSSSGQS